MRRKILLLMVTVGCIMLITACGNKENENTVNEIEKESIETTNPVAEKDEQQTETAVIQTEEELPETVQPNEEVIGDVDVSANELTMADMLEQELGMDIPVYVAEEGSEIAYKDKYFMVLFPSSMYVTEVADNGVRAKLETIDIVISTTVSFAEAPTNVNESRMQTMETIGNYVVVYSPGRNDEYGTQKSYDLYNTTDGTLISMTLTINKVDGYVDYANNLVAEYIPAFEEILLSNLQ